MVNYLLCFVVFLTAGILPARAQQVSGHRPDSLVSLRALPLLPQNFYQQHTGFFCKKEDRLQQHTGLNIFFRLGDKNYVDYLEKKPNAVKPFPLSR